MTESSYSQQQVNQLLNEVRRREVYHYWQTAMHAYTNGSYIAAKASFAEIKRLDPDNRIGAIMYNLAISRENRSNHKQVPKLTHI